MQPVTTPPRVFSGRYEITHLVARGGMAQVFRAHDRRLDRPVALKVLFPELSVDRAFVERFRREAQAAANLSHPNIVPVFDWGEDDNTYYIVMEYVEGDPLSQALRTGGPMPPPMVAHIGARVADALAYAHRHGVVHRDVKPGNVLLTADRQVKVTDFGIARAVNTEESLTQTGAVMGTATYFSPEQAEGLGVDGRSDIYSLGVVLFEMVAGRPPFLGDSPVAVASKHVRERPPLLRDLNPTVPPALEAIIAKAMAKSADLRYQSATDLRADLQRFAEGRPVQAADPATVAMLASDTPATGVTGTAGTTQAVPVTEGRPSPRREGSHVARWVLLLLLLLAVLGVIVYFVLQSLGYIGATKIRMPTVRNEPVATARSTLAKDGLSVSGVRSRHTTTVKKNYVISTTPPANRKITTGSGVSLLVSSGPVPRVTLPSVTGKPYTSAFTELQQLGFKVTHSTKDSTQPTGTVIGETPPGTTQVKKGATVHLTVSNQTSVKVPKILGDTSAQAGSALGSAGLSVGTTTKGCSTQYPTGTVMAQTPAATSAQPLHSKVNFQISTNTQCKVAVPSVVGKTESAAASAISGAGLTPAPSTTTSCAKRTTGKVLSQTPHSGTKVTKGSTVTIVVCKVSGKTTTGPPATTPHSLGAPPRRLGPPVVRSPVVRRTP
jgi:serine/threonine protein kinase